MDQIREPQKISGVASWLFQTFNMLKRWLDEANGWQRLWVVGNILWSIFIVYHFISGFPEMTSQGTVLKAGDPFDRFDSDPYCGLTSQIDWPTTRTNIFSFVGLYGALLIVVPLITYSVGVTASWVAKGFQKRGT